MHLCEAEHCKNSSEGGFKMCHFPSCPARRQKWIENVGRAGWTPKKYSTLCEVHFGKDMWENEQIFRKKNLKPLAVPTIFCRPATAIPKSVINQTFTKSILKVNVSEVHCIDNFEQTSRASCSRNICHSECGSDDIMEQVKPWNWISWGLYK